MYQQGSACYSTAQQANQAQASNLVGSIVSLGGEPYSVNVLSVTDTSIGLQLEQISGSAVITKTITASPQSCGLLQAEDAVALGWLIVAAWIGAFAMTFIARMFRDSIEEKSNYGHS